MKEKIFKNIEAAQNYCKELLQLSEYICIKPYRKTRTNQQNRALHLFFTFLADELNEFTSFKYHGILGKELECPYNSYIVKEYIWRPLQIALYDKKSTTHLTTKEINEMIDIINNKLSEIGKYLEFPSIENLYEKAR